MLTMMGMILTSAHRPPAGDKHDQQVVERVGGGPQVRRARAADPPAEGARGLRQQPLLLDGDQEEDH